jgi:hypothetical protein
LLLDASGEGYDWPMSNHGLTVDGKGNIWIGGNDADDGSNDTWAFCRVARIFVARPCTPCTAARVVPGVTSWLDIQPPA